MQTVLITGGTGLVGKALTGLLLSRGYKIIILTREPGKHTATENKTYAAWDIKRQTIDEKAISDADYIVHLAGAGVADKRWTPERKQEILESRTQSSALLVKALEKNTHKVKAVVSASGIGWYGEDASVPSQRPFTEADAPDAGFLGETCRLWEQSIEPVQTMGIRLVKLRTGIALSNEGGAFTEFKKPVYAGVAGIMSKGRQIMSWIHIDDLCRIYLEAIENEALSGAYNAVAPKPISNKEFTMMLAKSLKGSFYVPMHVPAFVLKIMLGEMSVEILKSATVSADKIRKTGFNFLYPTMEAAIGALKSSS